jgi:hypothetical protein
MTATTKTRTAARLCHHSPRVRTEAEHLHAEITAIAEQIDRRTGAKRGTAARAVYFWHWPPEPWHSAELLAELRRDAAGLLADLLDSRRESS